MNIIIKFYIFKFPRYQIPAQTDNFNFLDQIHPNKVFPVKMRTSEHDHGIQDI